jgi:hypothetical protein
LTLLNALDQSGCQTALAGLEVKELSDRYADEQLRLCLVLLMAWGVSRISHINDQPVEEWGIPLDTARRPDEDTLDQYLNRLIESDETDGFSSVTDRLGQIRPGGRIDTALQESLCCWVEAGLLEGEVWYFDDHVVEYTGQAGLNKTKHGTKHISVKAVNRYTLSNGLCSLSEYFPLNVSYAEAQRHLVSKANRCLPPAYRVRKLSFDRAGWDAELLTWLWEEQGIIPITWVKRTSTNIKLLGQVPDDAFVDLDQEVLVGKEGQHHVVRLADATLDFPSLGTQRVIVLETRAQKRIGIYTTALHPRDASLHDQRVITTTGLVDAMRFKQRIENGFKVDVNEMDSDAIPTHRTYEATLTEPYDLAQAEKQRHNADKRLDKYTAQAQEQLDLLDTGQLDKHRFNLLDGRTRRLRQKAEREIETISQELLNVHQDENGQTVLQTTTQVLDVRKLTLLNLFKTHALVALKILARQLGMEEAGPKRLRRTILAFGDRVEFDHEQRIVTVYARRFPRASTQQAYERLCGWLYDVPITLTRNGVSYRVRFSW